MRKIIFFIMHILNFPVLFFGTKLGSLYWILLSCSYITSNYFFVKELIRRYYSYKLKDDRKVLLLQRKNFDLLSVIVCSILHICYLHNFSMMDELALFITTFLILLSYRIFYELSSVEIDYLTESNNLSLGYGSALCYYENYLKLILHEYPSGMDFKTRVRMFESNEGVTVPSKIIILVPRSCKIITYIDDIECISRCKEIKPLKKDIAGIPSRRFNITVYNIRHRNRSVRLALEYAQPLKALYHHMKEKNRCTEEELQNQRDIFCRTLRQMLKDGKNSHELIELIEYDDEIPGYELQDILMDQQSIFNLSAPINAEHMHSEVTDKIEIISNF